MSDCEHKNAVHLAREYVYVDGSTGPGNVYWCPNCGAIRIVSRFSGINPRWVRAFSDEEAEEAVQ